ncbi:MAG: hypothetical protein ACR2GE_07675 [Pseudonocardia sp.]
MIVWLVWHHTDASPPVSAHGVWPSWRCAVEAIRGHRSRLTTLVLERDELAYRDVLARARREARLWRIDPPRQRRFTEPPVRSARFCSD